MRSTQLVLLLSERAMATEMDQKSTPTEIYWESEDAKKQFRYILKIIGANESPPDTSAEVLRRECRNVLTERTRTTIRFSSDAARPTYLQQILQLIRGWKRKMEAEYGKDELWNITSKLPDRRSIVLFEVLREIATGHKEDSLQVAVHSLMEFFAKTGAAARRSF